ncbi:autotransporter outer membrane beta-barrel domain-containing protein [Prosthecodimorpha staleyi]|uniref:Autotransporter outer membrane beta-barrel domain-containing protein n=1 Tax=Prosthecodimorpha staleyi TaxID=2840188 RepID=A0A947GB12_9HYPH|nr:autotransporter outer membrane beta-barrel domain-containing protein [Prosthecodimorpha staleyi]MBT9288197.1 autotransporter outer membrane beta-barrel domain-containing protein [Prosthecodimorpha staleyi]
MTSNFARRPALLAGASLFVLALAAGAGPVGAASFTVPNGTTDNSAKTLAAGETGTVEAGGILSVGGSTVAVTVSNSAGTATIVNDGTIAQTGTGRAIRYNGGTALSLVVTNGAGGVIQALGDDVLKVNANATYTITNLGTIHQIGTANGSGQALDLRDSTGGGTITNGSATVRSAVIRADGDDALRPGANTAIINYGTIASYGAVNTKCPDYLGSACNGAPSAHDAIDVGGNLGVTVTNYGTITGSRHGITADDDIWVQNEAGATIIGRNGSGVGSDGTGTVINYGTIIGAYAGAGNAYAHATGGDSTANNGDGDGVDIDGVATIENYGKIKGTGAGGVDSGGLANGSEGIAAGGGSIRNHAGALISGANTGILIDDGSGGAGVAATTLVNDGRIEGKDGWGVRILGAYNNVIDTRGAIVGTAGAIGLGTGDDTLTIRRGAVIGGLVDMGGGADTINLARENRILDMASTTGVTVNARGPVAVTQTRIATFDETVKPVDTTSALFGAIDPILAGRLAGTASSQGGALGYAATGGRAAAAFDSVDAARRQPGQGAWFQAFTGGGSFDVEGSGRNLSARWTGGLFGIDGTLSSGARIGGFVGGAGGSSSLAGRQSSDLTHMIAGLYGRTGRGGMDVDGSLTLGRTRDDTTRTWAAGGSGTVKAKSSPDQTFLSPQLALSQAIAFQGFTLTPAARLRYIAVFHDGYDETVAGTRLTFKDRTTGTLEGRLELNGRVAVGSGMVLTGTAGVIGTSGQGADLAGSFGGAGFRIRDKDKTGLGAYGAVGFEAAVSDNAVVAASIDGTAMRDGSLWGSARLGAKIRF